MSDVLDIGRLTTRIRGDDEARAQQLAMQMGELAGRRLPRALDGAGERAIVRAGLPAGAVVAVQRLDLRLRLAANVSPGDLAAGWAAAFEASLAALLARLPPGDADDDAPAVWFADAWAAETRHLVRRASGMADAWWAPDLAGGDDDAPDPVATAAILQRWLRRDPPRAIATMARLARSQGQFALLLTPAEAAGLTAQLARLAGRQASPTPPAPAAAASPAGPVSDHPAPPRRARPRQRRPPLPPRRRPQRPVAARPPARRAPLRQPAHCRAPAARAGEPRRPPRARHAAGTIHPHGPAARRRSRRHHRLAARRQPAGRP